MSFSLLFDLWVLSLVTLLFIPVLGGFYFLKALDDDSRSFVFFSTAVAFLLTAGVFLTLTYSGYQKPTKVIDRQQLDVYRTSLETNGNTYTLMDRSVRKELTTYGRMTLHPNGCYIWQPLEVKGPLKGNLTKAYVETREMTGFLPWHEDYVVIETK